MAKRTSRQRAASRRNIKKAQLVSARKRRGRLSKTGVLKAGVAVGAVIGGAVVTRKIYNDQFITMYHGTNHHAARQIVKNGYNGLRGNPMAMMTGVKGTPVPGYSNHIFMTKSKQSDYGNAQVKIRMRKSRFKKAVLPDYNDWPDVQYKMSARAFEYGRKKGEFKVSYRQPYSKDKNRRRGQMRFGMNYGTY